MRVLKAIICLVLLDLILFRVGLFWTYTPDFGVGLDAENWRILFDAARVIETRHDVPGTAVTVGSSVMIMGVDADAVNAALHAKGLPIELLRFGTHGSTCTDSALLAWNALRMHPWLVLYAAAFRDFPRRGSTDSQVARTFLDTSVELPLLWPQGAEALLDAEVRSYWKLYRYRYFGRRFAATAGTRAWQWWGAQRAAADGTVAWPPTAEKYFSPYRVTPESYATWERWRQSRRFDDYLVWLQRSGSATINSYRQQTRGNYGPLGNPQVDSLQRMAEFHEQRGVRLAIVYFPQNPVFRDPAARPYFDPELSQLYADLFARQAAAHGAAYYDLRDLLEAEDFYDLIHPNLEGARKLAARLSEIIEREWQWRVRKERVE